MNYRLQGVLLIAQVLERPKIEAYRIPIVRGMSRAAVGRVRADTLQGPSFSRISRQLRAGIKEILPFTGGLQ